ncbi:MAG: helix-turn-helix transcriptional regulator [Erysipelotrichaceae bacterium]|nr:helix-turn-helix transcriptional regulator [Erysipelotrichaceae bacterium]
MNDTVGSRIKMVRDMYKLSQDKFGKKIGLTQARIWQYESGLRTPKYDVIDRIANTYNVSTYWLLTGTNNIKGAANLTPSQRFKIAMENNGYNVKKLSKAACVPEKMLNDILAGDMHIALLDNVAECLNVTKDWILTGYDITDEEILERYQLHDKTITFEDLKGIGPRVRAEREFIRLSCDEFGKIFNMTESAILDYEDGKKLIPYDALFDMQYVLSVSVKYLIKGDKKILFKTKASKVIDIIDYLKAENAIDDLKEINEYLTTIIGNKKVD